MFMGVDKHFVELGMGKVMYDLLSSVERSNIGEDHLVRKDIHEDDVEA